ncbi:MAG TPA: RNA polymerase subunit sigma, partial [Planctomycetaceae bacterium]|nr:RNA polymerase subunit sigma [Planctomycetaceae bacterium]
MSGPIVRTGATPEFSEGWDRIFSDKKSKPIKSAT